MKSNKWMDMWLALPRGQRRAVVVLLCAIILLCVGQIVAWHYRSDNRALNNDYSLLEQEITLFRSQIDSIPLDERRPAYVRRTHATPDTTQSLHIESGSKASQKRIIKMKGKQRRIEPVRRIEPQ